MPLYARIMVWLIKEPFPHPFIDWEWISSAVRCWQRGVDVYIDNTCYQAFAHGRHNYSPLWLRMTFLPDGELWVQLFGLSFAVLFFIALATFPPPRRSGAFWVIFLATFSSLTAFALERANVDLIMFLLAVAGVNCWFGRLPSRLAGYGIFLVAGLLKFYPLVLLALALRERPRVFAGVCVAAFITLLGFGLTYHDEISRILANVPKGLPFDNLFAAAALPNGIVMMIAVPTDGAAVLGSDAQGELGRVGLALLTSLSIFCATVIERRCGLKAALAAMPHREAGLLIAGAMLLSGCFFAGQNVGYRAIMVLPALPGLLFLSCSQPSRFGRLSVHGDMLGHRLFDVGDFRPSTHRGCLRPVRRGRLSPLAVDPIGLVVGRHHSARGVVRLRARLRDGSRDDTAVTAGAQIALDIAPILSRSRDRAQMGTKPGRDATQETDHEIRHLL